MADEMSREKPLSEDESSSDNDDSTLITSSPRRRPPLVFTEKHQLLKLQLLPLRQVQKDLEERLGASSREIPGQEESLARKQAQEAFVRSNSSWKVTLIPGRRSSDAAHGYPKRNREAEMNQTLEVLAGSAQTMKDLWEDETIQEMLRRRRVRMDTLPGLSVHSLIISLIATNPPMV